MSSTQESSAKLKEEHSQKVPLIEYLKRLRLPKSIDSYTGTVKEWTVSVGGLAVPKNPWNPSSQMASMLSSQYSEPV